jgi:hypothetical protein
MNEKLTNNIMIFVCLSLSPKTSNVGGVADLCTANFDPIDGSKPPKTAIATTSRGRPVREF